MDALELFDTVPVPLPLKVKVTTLGYEIWLKSSAQAKLVFIEIFFDATNQVGSKTVKGCRVCLTSLKYGKQ